jgi:hypothetical protein
VQFFGARSTTTGSGASNFSVPGVGRPQLQRCVADKQRMKNNAHHTSAVLCWLVALLASEPRSDLTDAFEPLASRILSAVLGRSASGCPSADQRSKRKTRLCQLSATYSDWPSAASAAG